MNNNFDYNLFDHFFFVGIAGTGMSAIAQYLKGIGKNVSGSDRQFKEDEKLLIQEQFESMDIHCYYQDASGITSDVDVLVISTAIEDSNIEVQKAKALNIPIVKRSEVLASISRNKKTIAVGGTSGKSTTTAMIFHILEQAGKSPSIMSGAGLTALQERGIPGNAWVGKSDLLVIEADESDGSIVNYTSEIALLLNMDRDHKEYDELMELFKVFRSHTTSHFIVNHSHPMSQQLSVDINDDFGTDNPNIGYNGTDFRQEGFSITFKCNGIDVWIPAIGRHNMENALAAIAVCNKLDIRIDLCAKALSNYRGIYRRTQLAGISNKITIIDDFAHNPAEVVCAIKACQAVGDRLFAWFQPHGFGPLKFMHKELETEVMKALRPQDLFVLSDVYYAGGTVTREVTTADVVENIKKNSDQVVYFPDRKDFIPYLKANAKEGDVVLIMGARDTTLSNFANDIVENLC